MAQTVEEGSVPRSAFGDDHEPALVIRIAGVKALLAALTLPAIFFDTTVPAVDTPAAIEQTLAVASLFFLYMLLGFLALVRGWVRLNTYRSVAPFLDVMFSGALILATDGYRSPFSLWLAMAVVSAGFGSGQRIVLTATALAIGVQSLIAFVPQTIPLDVRVFAVRTSFLLCFGLVIAYIGNHVSKKSAMLASLDNLGSNVAGSQTAAEASSILLDHIELALRPRFAAIELDDGTALSRGQPDAEPLEFAVESGKAYFGSLRLVPGSLLTRDDERLLHAFLDRYALTIRRLDATEKLRRSAAQEARLRLADELHDTHIQTLSAIDFQIEGMVNRAKLPAGAKSELEQIRALARRSVAGLREFLSNVPVDSSDDLGEIVNRCRKGWKGEIEFEGDDTQGIPRGTWVAVEALLREGLANARKHARADWARFTLERESGMLVAKLETNGADPELPVRRYGYGLSRVAASVAGAGGTMSLTSRPGGGAVLSAAFGE